MTPDYAHDYRFGWRWILPGGPSLVVASDSATEAYLRACVPHLASHASLALIDADALMSRPDAIPEGALADYQCVGLFGSGRAVKDVCRRLGLQGMAVRDYGLLPPRNPRLVVPLSDSRATLQGLGLHNPGSKRAKAALWVLRGLAAMGIVAPMRQSMLRIVSGRAHRPWPLAHAGINSFDGAEFAQYLGSEGPNRKTVVLPIDKGRPGQIIKTAEHPAAREKLANEARILRYLATTSLSTNVPRLHFFDSGDAISILIQQHFQTQPAHQRKMCSAAKAFLEASFLQSRMHIPVSQYIQDRDSASPNISRDQDEVLHALASRAPDLLIPIGISHGDFAPWNCGIACDRLVVYDWEEGKTDGIPLGDAFSFAAFPMLLVKRIHDPAKIASQAMAIAANVYAHHGIDEHTIRACLALWCLQRPADFFPDIFSVMAKEAVNAL